MILPDASVDLSVQLGALASGERKFAYFPGRDRSDIPFGFAFVEVAGVEQGVPERGVAVFRDRADIQDYLGEVSSEGLTAANARWLGYLSGGKPSGCVCVMASVLRDGGVVHDELVPRWRGGPAGRDRLAGPVPAGLRRAAARGAGVARPGVPVQQTRLGAVPRGRRTGGVVHGRLNASRIMVRCASVSFSGRPYISLRFFVLDSVLCSVPFKRTMQLAQRSTSAWSLASMPLYSLT